MNDRNEIKKERITLELIVGRIEIERMKRKE